MSNFLSGNLQQFSISNLVQMCCEEKNPSQITIDTLSGQARIFFSVGEIIHACFNEYKGEEALYRVLRLTEGTFQLFHENKMPERTIHTSVNSLLLEGMRKIDENSRDEETAISRMGQTLKNVPGISAISIHTQEGGQFFSSDREDRRHDYAVTHLVDLHAAELIRIMQWGQLMSMTVTVSKGQIMVVKQRGLYIILHAAREVEFDHIKSTIQNLDAPATSGAS